MVGGEDALQAWHYRCAVTCCARTLFEGSCRGNVKQASFQKLKHTQQSQALSVCVFKLEARLLPVGLDMVLLKAWHRLSLELSE
jgi:hypothetical protein